MRLVVLLLYIDCMRNRGFLVTETHTEKIIFTQNVDIFKKLLRSNALFYDLRKLINDFRKLIYVQRKLIYEDR